MAFLTIAKERFVAPRHIRVLLSRLFSSSATFTVNDYLVSAFGIAPATAARISKPITHLKSPRNPDAVHRFLHAQGFSEAEVKTMVTRRSSILCSSPENTLAPNLRALREMNLSTDALNQIIFSDPEVLQLSSAVHKINFWKDFLLGQETDLIKLFKRNGGIICHDTSGGIATKISLMLSYGISIADIRRIICMVDNFITSSVGRMEDMLQRAKELGFQPQSAMFVHGLTATRSASREALQKKMDLLKSFGWSEEEFLSAGRKTPTMLCLSEENLQAKMEFLLGEARCHISYITFRPMLLIYSLKKRLMPRNLVLSVLESGDLCYKIKEFSTALQLSENQRSESGALQPPASHPSRSSPAVPTTTPAARPPMPAPTLEARRPPPAVRCPTPAADCPPRRLLLSLGFNLSAFSVYSGDPGSPPYRQSPMTSRLWTMYANHLYHKWEKTVV